MRTIGWVAAAAYVGTVWLANYLVQHYGVVDVGFGLVAPAGVFAAGIALGLRDIVQHQLGRLIVMGAIVMGAALSYLVSNTTTIPGGHVNLAVASGLAFLFSETADMSVYTPLRKRGWLRAVALSNTVGLVIDSALFLWLAFGSLAFFWGQCLGKAYMTIPVIILIAAVRHLPKRQVALA